MDKEPDLKVIEKAIESLSGVLEAKVVGDSAGIYEIHVLSRPTKPPKLLARDIETLLKTRFQTEVDHKKISVVSFDLDEETEEKRAESVTLRPVLWSWGWKKEQDKFQVLVEIKLGEKVYQETGEEKFGSRRERERLVSRMVLQCLNQIIGVPFFSGQEVFIVDRGDWQIVLCLVDVRGSRQPATTLVGSALVKEDPYEAVARATLDAVNRKLIYHLGV
ncbi:MAG: hypothetical protein PWP04_423 [Candidatus Atribacteria bacterium]|nr:hypothetical protein [Candidatus Atribacteria bacterium]